MSDTDPGDVGAAVRQILRDALGYLYPAALRAAVKVGAADQVAAGPKSAAEIAASTGANADHLRRVLRYLATRDVFREDEAGRFHLTTAAGLLRADSPVAMTSVVSLMTDPMYWRPAGRLDETVERGATVFGDIFGAQIFDYLVTAPEQEQVFSTAMDNLTRLEQGGVVASYRFPDSGTVVDVGGGRGAFLRAVLAANPGLNGILLERESAIRSHCLDDPDIANRWQTEIGDFYAEVPSGADIYLLKRILHDKCDADVVRILRSCRQGMAPGSRLLVIDAVAAPDGADPSVALSDVLMMAVFEGRERTENELRDLLIDADLKLTQVTATSGPLSIVEAVAN